MDYLDFIWFILSEEDKNTETSIHFFFRCLDIDEDGILSSFELEEFYKEQMIRLEFKAFEPIAFRDILCQVLDIIKPSDPNRITLQDMKRCKQASYVFNLFFNVNKFLSCEDPVTDRSDSSNWNSNWRWFASNQYELLTTSTSD